MNPGTERRIAALERSPSRIEPECMTLAALLEEAARLVGERDPAAAQRLRGCPTCEALQCARDMLGRLIGGNE